MTDAADNAAAGVDLRALLAHPCSMGHQPIPRGEPSFARYAVYWAPEETTALARFGARWLGAPAEAASALGLEAAEVEAATAEPARYGFHGTLLAPFRLKRGVDGKALGAHLERFAAARPPIRLSPLKIERIGSFLALVPGAREAKIRALHIQCLFAFERFRGPSAPKEQTRREAGAGETTEKLLLAQWGYAHVLHLFRFHLTLTGRLSDAARARFAAALEVEVEALNAEPVALDSLCLFGDPGEGRRFRLIARYPLGGRRGR